MQSADSGGHIPESLSVKRKLVLILPAAVMILSTGCVKMYSLPNAPPESEWTAAEEPEENPEDAVRRFLDAKRAAIQCYAALASSSWEKAQGWMSSNTKAFFESHSNGEGINAVFEKQTIWMDGEAMSFDPVGDVFIRDLNDIRDEFADRTDKESKTHKVLYAVSSGGIAREIVFVLEDDKWRLELTDISTELLAE